MDFGATRPDDARSRLRAAIEGLERVQAELQEIAASLPEKAGEPDGEVSLRSVIECVLVDSLQPGIRDLRAVVE
jgi:uncharacterized protein (UPF0335 family)